MELRHITRLLPRFAEPRCTHRLFSTDRRLLADPPSQAPPSPTTTAEKPPPYYTPSASQTKKHADLFKNIMSLSDESQQRASLKRVSQYDAKQRIAAELEKHDRAKALEKQQLRRWKAGDVYAPHDLSPVEMRKWRIRRAGGKDVFDMLGINPLMEYKNFAMMSEYMTSMGRIRHRKDTGLRAVNQRKIAKAIRRAVGMGLIPSVHKHPEVLEAEMMERNKKRWELEKQGKYRTAVA